MKNGITSRPNLRPARTGLRARLWAFVLPLLIVAQLALALHDLSHKLHPAANNVRGDCVLCHVASNMVAPPEPTAFVPPTFFVTEQKQVAQQDAAVQSRSTAGFRSRAPPLSA